MKKPLCLLFLVFSALFIALLSSSPHGNFTPRQHCFLGIPWMVWGTFIADLVTAAAYKVTIPATGFLIVVGGGGLRTLKYVPWRVIVSGLLFVYLCGTNHNIEAVNTFAEHAYVLTMSKFAMMVVSIWFSVELYLKKDFFSVAWANFVRWSRDQEQWR